jgi:protein gp37
VKVWNVEQRKQVSRQSQMTNSKIEWTDHTFNPWWGCVNVSPACDHCYAQRFANRKTRTETQLWGRDADRLVSGDDYCDQPHVWNRRSEKSGIRYRVFCGSMCDVMEARADLNEPRKRLFKLIVDTPHLDWMLLTKRPEEFSKLLPAGWLKEPRRNVWLMAICESQEYLWRIEALVEVPAVVHGVSLEPLLGPIKLPESFMKFGREAWVITGGESGPGARPTPIASFRDIRDQCVAAGVPFHFKQWGEHGADLVRIGKKKAGRILDGREWDEFPEVDEQRQ